MKSYIALELGSYSTKARIQAMRKGIEITGGEWVCNLLRVPLLQMLKEVKPTFAYTVGNHPAEAHARGLLRGLGIPLVVLDCGYFQRATGSQDREGYNQVGLGKLGWTPPANTVDGSRWKALDQPLIVAPRTDRPKNALILGQVPGDSQHGLNQIQLGAVLCEMSALVEAKGLTPLWRPHPEAPDFKFNWDLKRSPAKTLEEALDDCAMAITYNSTAGLSAIMNGIPVMCSPTAHYAAIAHYGAGKCSAADVMLYMHRLAWAQWTCEEIERAEPLFFLNQFANILPK